MPFPGAFGTSLATILGGQQQTADQAAAYNQQIQQRALEDQLRRSQLMMQLQDAQEQRDMMGTLRPEDQRALILGEPYADIQKRQAVGGRIQQWKNVIGQALIDPNRSTDEKQKLLQIYGTIDENTDPGDLEKQMKDFTGIGEKPQAQDDFQKYYSTLPKGTPMLQAWQQWKGAEKGGASDTTLKQIYDPKTGNTNLTYVPKSGAAGTSVGLVRPPMGANAIADADAASDGMVELQQNIKDLNLSQEQAKMPNWWAVGRQKLGFSAGDPKLTDMLAQVSVINTTLTGMVMRSWGTRNVGAAQEVIRLHVPTPTDSPDLINQKLDWWQKVGLRQYKTMLGAAPGAGSSTPSGTPVYVAGKLAGYTTDGKTMTPVGP